MGSDTEWYWVPTQVGASEKLSVKKLTKPKKDAQVEKVLDFVLKQSDVKDNLEELNQKFRELMKSDPPPTTTPLPDMSKMGGMGDMDDAMASMGGLGAMRDEM